MTEKGGEVATTAQKGWVRPAWAKVVDDLLKQREHNRAWLARHMPWSTSSLSRAMAGDPRHQPNARRRSQIAQVLEVPEYLIPFDPSPAKECPNESPREANE